MPYCVGGLIKLHLLQCQLYPFVKGNGDELFFKKDFLVVVGQLLKRYIIRSMSHFYILSQKPPFI